MSAAGTWSFPRIDPHAVDGARRADVHRPPGARQDNGNLNLNINVIRGGNPAREPEADHIDREERPKVDPGPVVVRRGGDLPRQGCIPVGTGGKLRLPRSANEQVEAFRIAFNDRRFSEATRYVSFERGGQRVPARVVAVDDAWMEVEVYDPRDGRLIRERVQDEALRQVSVSGTAMTRFAHVRRAPANQYAFHQRRLAHYSSASGSSVRIDFESPALQRVVARAVDLLSRHTGITAPPGRELSRSQRVALYEAWLRHVVPEVHDPAPIKEYAHSRDAMLQAHKQDVDLGVAAESQVLVCRELTLLASVVLAEFGLTSELARGQVTSPISGNRGTHAWLHILVGPGSTEILDSNSAENHFACFEDYSRVMRKAVLEGTFRLVEPGDPWDGPLR